MGLAALVLAEVVTQPVAGAERQQPEQPLPAEQVSLPGRVEVLDRAPQVEQRAADRRALAESALVRRRKGLLEQRVGHRRRPADVVVAERPDVLDLAPEVRALRVERR